MGRHLPIALCLSGLLAGPVMAAADFAKVQARVEEISTFAVAAGLCSQLGYRVTNDDPDTDSLLAAEAAADGLPLTQLKQWFKADQDRERAIYAAGKQAVLKAAGRDPESLDYGPVLKTAVVKFADQMTARCEQTARDPVFGKTVVSPGPADVATGRQDFMDRVLVDYGLASFQPPEALAQGDLLYAVGICRAYLSAADLKGYQGAVLDGPEPTDPAKAKLRRWYAHQLQDGLDGAGKLDRAGCAETLPRMRQALRALRSAGG